MLNLLIGPVAELAGTWLKGRVITPKPRQKLKVATEVAKAAVMRKVAAGEMEWNQAWAEGAQSVLER